MCTGGGGMKQNSNKVKHFLEGVKKNVLCGRFNPPKPPPPPEKLSMTIIKSNKMFCYFFGTFTSFIQHAFLNCFSEAFKDEESFKLAKLGEHFSHISPANTTYNYHKLSARNTKNKVVNFIRPSVKIITKCRI